MGTKEAPQRRDRYGQGLSWAIRERPDGTFSVGLRYKGTTHNLGTHATIAEATEAVKTWREKNGL